MWVCVQGLCVEMEASTMHQNGKKSRPAPRMRVRVIVTNAHRQRGPVAGRQGGRGMPLLHRLCSPYWDGSGHPCASPPPPSPRPTTATHTPPVLHRTFSPSLRCLTAWQGGVLCMMRRRPPGPSRARIRSPEVFCPLRAASAMFCKCGWLVQVSASSGAVALQLVHRSSSHPPPHPRPHPRNYTSVPWDLLRPCLTR